MKYFTFRCKIKYQKFFMLLVMGVYLFTFLHIMNSTKLQNTQEEVTGTNPIAVISTSDTLKLKHYSKTVIAVLVLVCNRPSVTRTLDQLFKYRPSAQKFPLILSQDCAKVGKKVQTLIQNKYGSRLTILTHPNYETVRSKLDEVADHMKGYYHIAAHYSWALNYTFNKRGFENVIIVEDDLDIAPDFFEYFHYTLPLLQQDRSLWCVSAYNDNGKPDLIDKTAPELLYRTDFFPGLGWMLTRNLWMELSEKWPKVFWDDWMRLPEQRQGRSCIRPEISRSKTFGRIGVSNGQFFDLHLSTIKLNDVFVQFEQQDLLYLLKDSYNNSFYQRVNSSVPVKSIEELESFLQRHNSPTATKSFRLTYTNEEEFRVMAKHIGLMTDFKSDVPRGGYNGIVSTLFHHRRLYLVPQP